MPSAGSVYTGIHILIQWGGHRGRQFQPVLADLPAGPGAGWPCPQGRHGCDGLLCLPFHVEGRDRGAEGGEPTSIPFLKSAWTLSIRRSANLILPLTSARGAATSMSG